jgi:hypothetical protein
MRRIAVLGLAIMTLSACASPTSRWVKPGTADIAPQQDVRACDREADRQARARPGHQQWATQGTRQAHMAGALASLRRAEHQELLAGCMSRKGYDTAG